MGIGKSANLGEYSGQQLSFLVELGPDEIILRVAGEVDMGSNEQLREAVLEQCRRRPVRLLLDLSGVTFFGSSGLTELIRADERCRTGGIQLQLLRPSPAVRRSLQLTGLDSRFQIIDSLSV